MTLEFIKSNILSKKLRSFLTVFSISISIILITLILNLFSQTEEGIVANAQNYDVLIGADGSQTQLAMNSLMFYDEPIGNIDSHYYADLKEDIRINMVVPIAMGDNYQGFKIIGTNNDYIENLNVKLSKGRTFNHSGEVVIGAFVAKKTNLTIGDTFTGTHGLGVESTAIHDESHEAFEYTIVGILDVTSTANDQAIFTGIESVWDVHGIHHHSEDEQDHSTETEETHEHGDETITAILVKSKSFTDSYLITKEFKETDGLQAINPAATLRKLLESLDTGAKVASLMAMVSVVLAVITLFVVMLSASSERLKDIAILRSLGAKRKTIFKIMLFETLLLSLVGCITGFIIAHLSLVAVSDMFFSVFGIFISPYSIQLNEMVLVFITLVLSAFAGVIPAFRVYKTDASRHLK